jgi:hypothetical protein
VARNVLYAACFSHVLLQPKNVTAVLKSHTEAVKFVGMMMKAVFRSKLGTHRTYVD